MQATHSIEISAIRSNLHNRILQITKYSFQTRNNNIDINSNLSKKFLSQFHRVTSITNNLIA
jgi:hypothetical protein